MVPTRSLVEDKYRDSSAVFCVHWGAIYRRPNLEDDEIRMNKDTLALGLGLLSGSCETAASEAAMDVLLFLLSWLEDLKRRVWLVYIQDSVF